jgi:CheY-like chemotaxis protein
MGVSGWNPDGEKDPLFSSPFPSEEMPGPRRRHILVVEDNKADVFLIDEAIRAKVDAIIQVIHSGDTAILFFEEADSDERIVCPDLVILDINLPKKHGGEVLSYMRKSRKCAGVPVLVVTSSDSARDREEMAKQGANGYFKKPSDYESFMKLGQIVEGLLAGGDGGDPES